MNADNVYEDIQDRVALKRHMSEVLDEYNNTPGVIHMDLVLFKDAIEHGIKHLHVDYVRLAHAFEC